MPPIPVIDIGQGTPLDRSKPRVEARTLWSMVLLLAIKKMATVVRFEPHRGKQSLTYRRNGHYHMLMAPPRHMTLDLIQEMEAVIETGAWPRPRRGWMNWFPTNHGDGTEEPAKKALVELRIDDQLVDAIISVEPKIFSRSVVIYLVDSTPPYRTRSMASRRAAKTLKRIFADWGKNNGQQSEA